MINNKFNILVLNGPNINIVGTTNKQKKYSTLTLKEIIEHLEKEAVKLNVKLDHFQSNAEHEIINRIHQAKDEVDYILINPAAFTHTSIAIRDAIFGINIPFIEIHCSNVNARESFRRHSYLSDLAVGVICGLGADSYLYALQAAVKHLSQLP